MASSHLISREFGQLLRDLPSSFTEEKQRDVVQMIKETFRGRFESIDNDDLYSCLTLLANEGYVSETKLNLMEFIAPKSNSPEQVKERIELFKASNKLKCETKSVLQGRDGDIKDILMKLETDQFPILNLYGSAGVGKTTLARKVCSKWQGKTFRCHYVFDLRKTKNVNELCIDIMSSLDDNILIQQFIQKNREQLRTTTDKNDAGYKRKKEKPKESKLSEHTPKEMPDNRSSIVNDHVDVSKLLRNVRQKIQQRISEGQHVLFLFDDVDSLVQKDESQAEAFLQFLRNFLQGDGESDSSVCKVPVVLTSRSELQDEMVENFEVKSLVRDSGHQILLLNGITNLSADENEKVIDLCQGNPLLLNAVSSVLRQKQETSTVRDVIGGIDKKSSVPEKGTMDEYVKEKAFDFQKEGIDFKQVNILKEMFDSLPSYYLKSSAIAVSLFCGPFSPSYGSAVLGVCLSEAGVVLEGLRTSKIISLKPGTKELMYDIHPLLKTYVNTTKNDPKYKQDYEKAKAKFSELFRSELLIRIAGLIDCDCFEAFKQFEMNRPNIELALEISRSPCEFQETAVVVSFFDALLSTERIVPLLRSWIEKVEDDGESGTLFQANVRCWEALQVLEVDGTDKAFEVLRKASKLLQRVEDKNSTSYSLGQGLYLYAEGEIYYQKRDFKKSLKSLESSLSLTADLLQFHSHLARCYNAVGNCQFWLNKPMRALEFYNKAYKMQEQLSGSNHIDLPMYKNQIATVYETQGDYEKAVNCYYDALSHLERLQFCDGLDEAHFCRNLANALMFQKKYSEAVEPAERAYNRRMKLLGNHPLTVRSIFQRAVLQANFEEFEKALGLFLEAWEMEKSLGAGNHSEVWRKVITGVEDMYCAIGKKEKIEEFRKDTLKFCQQFWDEEKCSAQFNFTSYNKEIIDVIIDLLGDKQDEYEVEKDALWFYEGMQSVTEKEFQEEFDQETGNSVLNEMLKERDEILDKVIKLSCKLGEHEILTRYKKIKLALYKKVLVRADFVGTKDYAFDKATLRSKVEQLYRDIGEEDHIPEFQENLLHAWQKQWKEGKPGEKTTEQTISGILQLCKELKREEMLRRYRKEALIFYENLWELKQAEMEPLEMKKFLRYLKQLASSIGDHERKKCYHEAYQVLLDGKKPRATLRSRATENVELQVPLADEFPPRAEDGDDESEEEEEIEYGSEDETDTTQDKKTLIRRGIVTGEGDTWYLEEAAGSVTFCHGAVTEPLVIACSLWSHRTPSPPLGSNEALVSNVIELSHDGPPDLELSGDAQWRITVTLMHSASDLKGYEVVIKQLVDPDNEEWIDLVTKNIWHAPARPGVPLRKLIPSAEATCTVTRHSSFAAVWRLKSFTFSRQYLLASEFTCVVPDYPDVSVQIPRNCVPSDDDFCLTLKVQEFPSSELKGESLLVGPILDISSSCNIPHLEPVTIKIPLTLREGKRELAQLFPGRMRILHCNSGDDLHAWEDITEQLEEPASITDGTVTFKMKHFSRIWLWIKSFFSADERLASELSSRSMPQHVRFSACLCKTDVPEQFVLPMYCYPSTLQHEVDVKLSKDDVLYQGHGNSGEQLCIGDKISVSLKSFILQDEETEIPFLRFLGNEVFDHSGLVVSVEREKVGKVKFFKNPPEECSDCPPLCTVAMRLRTSHASPQTRFNAPSSTQTQRVEVTRRGEVTVILLGTEWRSTKGGLSTINRELAKQLSLIPDVKVILLVPRSACSEDDKEEARAHDDRITIIEWEQGQDSDDQPCLPKELIIDVIIGHGVKLGPQARDIRDTHQCKWVQMVHTAPQQLCMYKNYSEPISKGEEKNKSEVELCEEADLVVAIGPKLREFASDSLRPCKRKQTVFEMTPSIFSEFRCVKCPTLVESDKFYVLAFGRCDPEDFFLKGFDIAAKAIAELNDLSYHLTIVGATDGKQEQLVEELCKHDISRCQLTVNKFCENREHLGKVFSRNDLVIMPSRTDGFGLTALEALSAGLPILASGNTGFAKALKKVPFGKMYVVEEFDNVKEWAKQIKAVRQTDRAQRLEEIKTMRTKYEETYSWEKQCEDLVAIMTSLVHAKPVHTVADEAEVNS